MLSDFIKRRLWGLFSIKLWWILRLSTGRNLDMGVLSLYTVGRISRLMGVTSRLYLGRSLADCAGECIFPRFSVNCRLLGCLQEIELQYHEVNLTCFHSTQSRNELNVVPLKPNQPSSLIFFHSRGSTSQNPYQPPVELVP